MVDYNDLNDDEKRTLRTKLNIERMSQYYLEDNNILLMTTSELFEYIYLYDLKKMKDAINLINTIVEKDITNEDVNKTIMQKVLESKSNVTKLSDLHYMYKES